MTDPAAPLVTLNPQRADLTREGREADGKSIFDTQAVALSGGGYRAMLFHLGFLWRLRDAGILQGIDRFSSVSGGAITAGMLAVAWTDLDWTDEGESFRRLVADPILELSRHSIDVVGALLGRIPGLQVGWTRRAYDRYLFKGRKLRDIDPKKVPRFVFNATSLHSGKLVRINQEYFADYSTAKWHIGDMTVATAVCASSAFPPVLSPVVVDLSDHAEQETYGTFHAPPRKLFLADGGVYDNLGLEAVWKRNRTVYVSDAGAAFAYSPKGTFLLSTQAMKVVAILQDQIGALRTRQMLHGYREAAPGSDEYRKGFLVSSDYMMRPVPDGGLPFVEARARELAATRTSLSKYDPALAGGLVNWGYVATDHRLRKAGLAPGRCALPYAGYPIS